MNPARMLGRTSLSSATSHSATAKLVTLVTMLTLASTAACSSDSAKSTSKPEGASESDAGHSEADAAARKPAARTGDTTVDTQDDKSESKAEQAPKAEPSGKTGTEFCGVLKVMQSDCQVCHGSTPVAGAPMPLVTFEDFMKPAITDPARKVYELVDERVRNETRTMPPAGILSADKLAALDAWLKAGLPSAKASSCEITVPSTRTEPDDTWPEDCEDIYTIAAHDPDDPTKPFEIPAEAEIHPYIPIDAPWGDDEVQLLATRPITDNEGAVHHWILWEAKDRINLTFWAPGATGDSFPDDVGLYMPKGKKSMALDMHYYNKNNDKPVYDRSGLEVCVTRKNRRPKTATLYGLFGNANVPAKQRVENSTSCTVTGELHLMGVNPHMHHMGRHGHLSLQRGGTGPIEVLYDGPFSFEEQTMKTIEETVIKAGDVLTTKCTFENTTDRAVTFGEDTENEMCINWVRYYPKGGFTCSRMMTAGEAPIDPNSTGNGGPFPTGEDLDAGAEPASN
jgi:mono/diheme cytochrome c family protein